MPAELYVRVREREGRLLPDDIVQTLPNLPTGHPHAREWRLRADSSHHLVTHLRRLPQRPLRVLDLGCGNGWLCARIAGIRGAVVVGTDINDVELEQARRVFPGVSFVHHDMRDPALPMPHPDAIVVASAIQYVADPVPLLAAWLDALSPHGEIHILDTPIYADAGAAAAARERSRRHYEALGIPEMAGEYHHHTRQAFAPFRVDVLHDPASPAARLQRRVLRTPRSPFPWLRIRRDAKP